MKTILSLPISITDGSCNIGETDQTRQDSIVIDPDFGFLIPSYMEAEAYNHCCKDWQGNPKDRPD